MAVTDRSSEVRHVPHLRVGLVVSVASGGTARHVAALAEGCQDNGLAVSVLGPEATLRRLRTSAAAVPVAIGDRPRPLRDLSALVRLRRWVASWRPDLVHAHGVRAGAFAAAAIALTPRRGRPALVVTVHNAPPSGRGAAVIHAGLELICVQRADLVQCASADLMMRLQARGAAETELVEVPAVRCAAMSVADVAAVRRELCAAGRPVILAVGRLAPQKGLDVLIEAAAQWRDRSPRPVTVIAGDGPLAAALCAQAARFADGDVRLLGHRDDVPVLLAAADVVVVPSRWEARALIVQEAMHAGRPIVASRVGGIPDLAGEDTAVLIRPGDPAVLAAAVTALLDDPELAARLGSGARAKAASFPTAEDVLNRTLDSYACLATHRHFSC
ncbi:MAG: glycosyltransferase family 4 protein [Actinobacteria bacterium]|nr:glycosyltransferase family 4 protein [Actinomycetota bacterium]